MVLGETQARILDALAANVGRPLSVQGLTAEIRRLHGGAYYANVHRALRGLVAEGVARLERRGRTNAVALDLGSDLTVDALAIRELQRKRALLLARSGLRSALADLASLGSRPEIRSVSLVEPERNAKLRRAELLVLTRAPPPAAEPMAALVQWGRRHNLRADALVLDVGAFVKLLGSTEANPAPAMAADRFAVVGPHAYWWDLAAAVRAGARITTGLPDPDPRSLPEDAVAANLRRLGYREFGPPETPAGDVRVEVLAIALLLRGEARRVAAVPVILAKNPFLPGLVAFLARKHGVDGQLLGLLRASRATPFRGRRRGPPPRLASPQFLETEALLETGGAQEVRVDPNRVQETLRLYHAAG